MYNKSRIPTKLMCTMNIRKYAAHLNSHYLFYLNHDSNSSTNFRVVFELKKYQI